MEIGFAQDCEVTNVKDRIGSYVLWPQTVVMEDLAKEKGTRWTETPGDVLREDGYLVHVWSRADLFGCPALVDYVLRRKKVSRLHLAQLEISRL